MRCYLAFLLLLAIAVRAEALEPQRATMPQVRQWIAQLDDDDFAARERAAASLARAGQVAITPLAEGVVSLNPEVAWRCSETLERIAMEGDEATMDRVVLVLGQLAARGKPQLGQFAAEMRQRQRVFRHNRAATALRKLGGQVAGGDVGFSEDAGADEITLIEREPVIAALEGFIIEEAPALELPPAAEAEAPKVAEGAAWPKLLESLKLLEIMPATKRIDIDEDTKNTIELEGAADAAAKESVAGEPKPPAIGDSVAAAVLPGKVGTALRRALGLGEGKKREPASEKELPRVAVDPAGPAKDFSVPPLEGGEDAPAVAIAKAADEAKAAADKAEMEAGEAVEAVDFAVIGAPVFFGGGMAMGFDGGVSPGYMMLGREWRGGDAGLKHLKDLNGIAQLQIDHADLSDAALPHIASMKSLTYVSIRGGKFSSEALRAFHRARPKVSLMAMGEGMMGVMGAFNAEGCFLDSVQAGTAAHEAGLQAGDKVTSIAGESIADFSELTIAVSTRRPGDKLKVVYERGGERREADLTLKARPAGQ
jgi:hypothetical protein